MMRKKSSSTDGPSGQGLPRAGFHLFDLHGVQPGEATPFPIYIFKDEKPIRWREAGLPFESAELDTLLSTMPPTCFVEANSLESLARFLEGRLFKAVKNTSLGASKHTALLESAISTTILALYERPSSPEIRTSIHRLTAAVFDHLQKWQMRPPPRSWGSHVFGVTLLSCFLAERAGLPKSEVINITSGALVHDLGFALDAEPPGPMETTHRLYDEHPELGCTLLVANGPVPSTTHDIVRHHHERIDGSGFPFGLTGPQITIGAQIVGLADELETYAHKQSVCDATELIERFVAQRGHRFSQTLLALLHQS